MENENIDTIDFTSFILSLSSSAIMAMGEMNNPHADNNTDFCMARETIKIIEMLSEKTKGNLTGEERGVVDSVLIDLRMQYVSCIKSTT
jgi:Domain of unknown function (DUF1844)